MESIYGMNMVSVKQYYNSKGTEPKLLIFQGTNHEKEFEGLEQLKQEIRKVSQNPHFIGQNIIRWKETRFLSG